MIDRSRPYTFDRVVRIIIGVLMVIGAIWLIDTLSNVLLPFCLACLIAYILEPIVEFNRKLFKRDGRVLAVFVTLTEVTLVIAAICYFCVPIIIAEVQQLGEMIKASATSSQTAPWVSKQFHDFFISNINYETFQQLVEKGHLQSLFKHSTAIIYDILGFLIHTLEWLLTFVYVIFIMLDYDRLMRGLRMMVPPKYRKSVFRVCDDIKDSMNRYFRGQAFIALCAAVLYCIGFSIVGIPMAIVLGVVVGVLFLIPYFQYVTLIPVAIVCYISSLGGDTSFWSLLCQCGVVYLVSQCICDYVLTPKVMGKALGLNPAIILLSLSVWGTLLGLIGMIIALPLTTLILAYYQKYVQK